MKVLIVLLASMTLLTHSLWAADSVPAPKAQTVQTLPTKAQVLDLKKVYSSSPVIYSILTLMSISSVVIWLYSLAMFRSKEIMPATFTKDVRLHLEQSDYRAALDLCHNKNNLLSSIICTGLSARNLGSQVMVDAMKSQGKRSSTGLWQRLSILHDIMIVAPMLGLLGTVIGMFYAFYDVNRSVESINALFDGIGIAVGTTVMGLIVSIVAMIFYTTLKYRLVKVLTQVETEALSLSTLIATER